MVASDGAADATPVVAPMNAVVINECFGGFSLSPDALTRMKELGYEGSQYDIPRDDPRLVQVVRDLGDDANGRWARLVVIELPAGVTKWHVHEYDGYESVHSAHRTWQSEGVEEGCS